MSQLESKPQDPQPAVGLSDVVDSVTTYSGAALSFLDKFGGDELGAATRDVAAAEDQVRALSGA